jgi:hypothetical protein
MYGLRRNDFSDGSQRNSDILPEVGIAPCVGGGGLSVMKIVYLLKKLEPIAIEKIFLHRWVFGFMGIFV